MMGLVFKAGLALVALVIAALGGLPISLLIFACLLVPPLFRRWRRSPRSEERSRGNASFIQLLGVSLVLLSFVALLSHGTLSPIVLGSAGLLLLIGPHVFAESLSTVAPLEGSTTLRSSLLPFKWYLLAEAKVSTRDPEGVLSGVKERVLFLSTPSPRIFFIFSASALSRKTAEDQLMRRARSTARSLRNLGVYVLPLDSREAFRLTSVSASKLDVPVSGTPQFLSSMDYTGIQIEASHGFVTRFEVYREDEGSRPKSLFRAPGKRPGGSILFREMMQSARQRIGMPQPDEYVAFLSSMAATEGETLGQRLTETSGESGSDQLSVASLGSPKVTLLRAQLRAVLMVYV